jgi:hypothetical protein
MVLLVLLVLTAIAAGLAPRAVQIAGRDPAMAAPPAGTTNVPTVEETLNEEGMNQRVTARAGQPVVIDVQGDQLDTVSIENLGVETVDPDSPAHFELLADTPGRYPITLLEARRQIGTLIVAPAG